MVHVRRVLGGPVAARLAALLGALLGATAPRAVAEAPPPPPQQQPSDDEVEHVLRHLDGATPREVAWGAFLAAEGHIDAAAPRIVARLAAEDPVDRARMPLRIALLDALVVLDPVIDPAMLLPHAQAFLRHGVITFLARHPDRYGAACVELFRRTHRATTSWLALGNALAAARTPGFAATVLGGLEVTLTVRVFADARDRFEPPTRSVPGCGLYVVPAGWPPPRLHRLFALRAGREPEGYVFAGRYPIVSERCGGDDRNVWTCSSVEESRVPPDEARLVWLEGWGCVPSPLAAAARLDVIWASPRDYLRRVRGARDARDGALRALVGAVARAAPPDEPWADARDAGPGPRVRVVIEDHRTSPWRKRLPELPEAAVVALPRARSR